MAYFTFSDQIFFSSIFLLQNSMKVCFTLFVLFALQFFYNLILRNCTGLVVKILILVTLKFALFLFSVVNHTGTDRSIFGFGFVRKFLFNIRNCDHS